jgi:hypothetical protein
MENIGNIQEKTFPVADISAENTANLQGNSDEKVGYKKPPKSKQFKTGFDPRRNMKGVPRDTLLMRKHMRKIAAELIGSGETEMTRLDAMLRQLFTSRNPAHNKLALQVLDPKLLTEHTDITSGGEQIKGTIVIIEHDDTTQV